MVGFVTYGRYAIENCPEVGFEFPQRFSKDGRLVVSESAFDCHGYQLFDVYRDTGAEYLERQVRSESWLAVRLDRSKGCHLEVLSIHDCEVNQHKESCKETVWPEVTAKSMQKLVNDASRPLFGRTKAIVGKNELFKIIGFREDVEDWCAKAAETRFVSGRF